MEEMHLNLYLKRLTCKLFGLTSIVVGLLIFMPSFFALGQEAIINGKAPGYKGAEISLVFYDDYLAFTERRVINSTIDSAGFFSFKPSILSTTDTYLRVKGMEAVFYLAPNKAYSIELHSDKNELKIQFGFDDPNDINNVIKEFKNSIINYNNSIAGTFCLRQDMR